MSTPYIPGNGVPLPEENKSGNGCLKWGGIGAGLLILLSIVGSCGGGDSDPVVETQTVTVTTGASASTVTTTATTTVTTSPSTDSADTSSVVTEEPEEQPAANLSNDVDTSEDDDTQRAQFFAPAPEVEQPAPAPAVEQPAPVQSAYYANCSQARSAGAAPLYAGDPGYSSKLDRDGDGVACE